MPLLSTIAELFVLLLALQGWAAAVVATSLAAVGLGGIFDGDVEEVVGIIGRTGGVGLALCGCIVISIVFNQNLPDLGGGTHSSSKHQSSPKSHAYPSVSAATWKPAPASRIS